MQGRWLAKLGRDLISSCRPSRLDLPSRCLASMALSVNLSVPKPVSARSRRNKPPDLGFYPISPLLPVRFYSNSVAFSSIYFLIEIRFYLLNIWFFFFLFCFVCPLLIRWFLRWVKHAFMLQKRDRGRRWRRLSLKSRNINSSLTRKFVLYFFSDWLLMFSLTLFYMILFVRSFKSRFRTMNDGQIRRWRAGKRHNAHLKVSCSICYIDNHNGMIGFRYLCWKIVKKN